jgi:hypothetical protein
VRADHAIFQGPLRVELPFEDREIPNWADGKHVFRVHEGEFGKGCDVGMVADGHGFEDSPDCERISGGVNSKGTHSVAIGRQANMLMWGFYGAPDRMTPAAKRAFLNAIVWMRQFDGQRPLVQRHASGRTWLEQYIDTLAGMTEAQRTEVGENAYATYLKKHFPAELVGKGFDAEQLRQWYRDNLEYFRCTERFGAITIDADLVKVKQSNRKPEFLDWLAATLTKDAHDATALALAQRYLDLPKAVDAAAVRTWIETNRPFLFFSDVGGYRWFVDTNAQRAASKPAKTASR